MQSNMRNNQAGFSLLEVLIAVGILSAAAYVALDTVENNTGQHRYDLTNLRLEKIRRAIVGDPGLVMNNTPVVSGFVADVGRLPGCLEELIDNASDCGGTVTDSPPTYSNVTAGLSFGWRGPYLTAGADGIADGWGNSADGDVDWGWSVTLASGDGIDVASLGRDRASGHVTAATYDEDQDMIGIVADDFRLSLATTAISVEITNSTGAAINFCVALIAPDPDDATDWVLLPIAAPVPISVGDSQTLTFTSTDDISIGRRPLIIYNADDTSVGTSCEAALTKADIISNALLGSISLTIAPRIVPTGNLNFTL